MLPNLCFYYYYAMKKFNTKVVFSHINNIDILYPKGCKIIYLILIIPKKV